MIRAWFICPNYLPLLIFVTFSLTYLKGTGSFVDLKPELKDDAQVASAIG